MSGFILAAIIVIALVLAIFLLPVIRQSRVDLVDRQRQNIDIARERLAELEVEVESGLVTPEDLNATREELEQALLSDIEGDGGESPESAAGSVKPLVLTALLLIPLLTGGLYTLWGTPEAIGLVPGQVATGGQSPHAAGQLDQQSVIQMVEVLAKRMEAEPDNTEGWLMLGQSYMTMQRFPEAVEAFRRLNALLQGSDPQILLRQADAMAMAAGGRISGEPASLVEQALAMEPNNITGLWLAGLAAEEQEQYPAAIGHWRRLEPLLAANPDSLSQVQSLIRRAEEKLGIAPAPVLPSITEAPQATGGFTLKVALAKSLAAEAEPDDTVFIIVKAHNGAPMPLAAVRKQVRELPLTIAIDDSLMMVAGGSLADHPELRIEARVSKQGGVKLLSGDLIGVIAPVVQPVSRTIEVVIDQQVK